MPETLEMGRVVVSAIVENIEDLWRVKRGDLSPTEARRVEIADALVDTGATTLCLPEGIIEQLGLIQFGERTTMSSQGPHRSRFFGPVRLTVQGRECNVDVVELPDGVPTLIGQIPLESLDFIVDPPGRRLIGNPAHNGEQMVEVY